MICDFYLYVKRMGMAKSIDERLAPTRERPLQD